MPPVKTTSRKRPRQKPFVSRSIVSSWPKEEQEAYNNFRTGLSFSEIFWMLRSPSEDPKDWPNITYHTVLGKWHQIKLEMFSQMRDYELAMQSVPLNYPIEEVPF